MSEKSGKSGLFSKILFVVGIIIILVLLAWAVINFVPAVLSSLANVGSSIGNKVSSKNITVLVNDNDLNNGDEFTTYWRFTPTEDGLYSLTHDCLDGISFDIHIGEDTKRLICNLPITLPRNTVSVGLTAYNTNTDSYVDVPIKVMFTPDTEQNPSHTGETMVTIKNDNQTNTEQISNNSNNTASSTPNGDLSTATITSESVQPSTESMTVVQQPTTPIYTNNSRADLVISNTYSYPNQSRLQFDIYNIGGQNSGTWQFSYTDPSTNNLTQYSPLQPSLRPNQGMRFYLTFNEQDNYSETVIIKIDPANTVYENSESNNTAYVIVTGNNSGNNNTGSYDPNDDADLVIDDLEVGYLSGSRFYEDDNADEGDDVAIRFEVKNQGGESTGSWRFEVRNMPFDDDDDYRSPRQNSLRPGEIKEIILEFENIDEGNYTIRVEVDSEDDVDEESESNNDDSVRLEVDR